MSRKPFAGTAVMALHHSFYVNHACDTVPADKSADIGTTFLASIEAFCNTVY